MVTWWNVLEITLSTSKISRNLHERPFNSFQNPQKFFRNSSKPHIDSSWNHLKLLENPWNPSNPLCSSESHIGILLLHSSKILWPMTSKTPWNGLSVLQNQCSVVLAENLYLSLPILSLWDLLLIFPLTAPQAPLPSEMSQTIILVNLSWVDIKFI